MSQKLIELGYKKAKANVNAKNKTMTAVGNHSNGYSYEVISKDLSQNGSKNKGVAKFRYKVGDTLAFTSEQGYITVKLPTGRFEPEYFSTDPVFCKANGLKVGDPVVAKKVGKFQYWCGFSVGFPNNKKLGDRNEM